MQNKKAVEKIGTITLGIMLILFGAATLLEGKLHSGSTVFTVAKNGEVFFGGNDDDITPDSYYRIDPGDSQNYGAIWIGPRDYVKHGVNEKGLAYGSNRLPSVKVNPHIERDPVLGDSYPIHILHTCASVEEVIKWVNTHQWHSYMQSQMHFADAGGDAVIISTAKDGELSFTRKLPGNGFLVSSDFNVADPANGFSYPCWRNDRAQELLGELLQQEGQLTARDAANVLDAVHMGDGSGLTMVSLVADLSKGVVYLYYYHQLDRPVVLRVKEELANRRPGGPLSALFPEDVHREADRRYQQIQAKKKMHCQQVSMVWLAVVLVSLVFLIAFPIGGRRELRLWMPAVILLGPLALLVRFSARQCRQSARWRIAMVEAVGDIMPVVIAFVAILDNVLTFPPVKGANYLQPILILGLPLVMGWFFFHGPLLAPVAEKGCWRFLNRRLPQVLVTANIGMGGIGVMALPLILLEVQTCPRTVWSVITWWFVSVLGTLLGILLISLYESWAVKRGFQAWSALAWKKPGVRTPSWRQLWWWIPISYAALLGGLTAGVFLSRLILD